MPSDPAARAEIRSLEKEVAAAKALEHSGQTQQALERLRQSAARIEKTAYGPLLLSYRVRIASGESASDPKASVTDYEEAMALADSYRLDESRAESAIAVARLDAGWLGQKDDARRWLRFAEGAIARLGGDARLEVIRDIEDGWESVYDGKQTDRFQTALGKLEAAHLDNPDFRIWAHAGIAAMNDHIGKMDDCIRYNLLAIAEFEGAYGPEHPGATLYIDNLAGAYVKAGRLRRRRSRRQPERWRSSTPPSAACDGAPRHAVARVRGRRRWSWVLVRMEASGMRPGWTI